MIQKVLLPKLGQTVERAVIDAWHKAEGDAVARGDVLCEITTDKATLEVESYAKGTLLRILGRQGEELPVNCVIAIVGDPGEEIPESVLAEAAASREAPPGDAAAASAPTAARPLRNPPRLRRPPRKPRRNRSRRHLRPSLYPPPRRRAASSPRRALAAWPPGNTCPWRSSPAAGPTGASSRPTSPPTSKRSARPG
jgi:pyruvate/2-oxoglutarate dehydrogenase complex dihydrolipoamide acyltransferase (E2) component